MTREATQEEREGVEQYIDSIVDIAPSKWMAEDVLNKLIGAEVLDKIRVEIEGHKSTIDKAISEDELKIEGMKEAYADCLEIIDKYKL